MKAQRLVCALGLLDEVVKILEKSSTENDPDSPKDRDRVPDRQLVVTGNSTDLKNQLLPHIFLTMLNNHFGVFQVAS